MRWVLVFASLLAACTGCAASCPTLQERLEECRQTITDKETKISEQQSALNNREKRIAEKNETIESLEGRIAKLEKRLNISGSEQQYYDKRLSDLTSGIRSYIKGQIQQSRDFLTRIELEDFIGNPLIERRHLDEEARMIVDTAHPVPGKGQINGIGGYFRGSGRVLVKILRPVGEDYIVAASKALKVGAESAGKHLLDFDNPVIVNKGDLVGYYLPGPAGAAYDSGIGVRSYFRMREDAFPRGGRIESDEIWRENEPARKYSLNYYGVFSRD
ncbi:MAG TPA: hypothetical protein VKO20_02130 [Desulfosalsimonadaceae bacterium]|nr:hypothetical protein [Desulfosalsimonadaceae bacterium]